MGSEDGGRNKKFTLFGIASVLLVAAVVGTVVTFNKNSSNDSGSSGSGGTISTTNKAAKALCQQTDYKQTCEESLKDAKNTTEPKELVKIAFNAAVARIEEAMKNSKVLQEASKDPRTAEAFTICKEVLNTSMDDLRRSFDQVGNINMGQMDEYAEDVKSWLSGAITYQETCMDAFENTTGDTGEKMKKLLKTANELTRNGLAMIGGITEILGGLDLSSFSRRLLEESSEDDYKNYPEYDKIDKRRLLQVETSNDDYMYYTPQAAQRRALLKVDPTTLKPNATVAQDGSGTHKTINDALLLAPKKSNYTFVIFIKAGIYQEYIIIPRHYNNIVLIGEGATKTRITGNKNYVDGIGTYRTATVAVNGDGFLARDIGFENTAGPMKHQAIALRVSSDMAIFYRCQMDGYQDTLYTHSYRQFYRECNISGTIDFIFGDAAAVFQKCNMIVRKPLENQACMVTAQGRVDRHSLGGIVIQGSTFTAEKAFTFSDPMPKAYLGRPWKEYSRTIIMESNIENIIAPEGWSPWAGTFALDTLYYAEYNNKGPGSSQTNRVTWKGIKKITPKEVEKFTATRFIQGDLWVKPANVPYDAGFMQH